MHKTLVTFLAFLAITLAQDLDAIMLDIYGNLDGPTETNDIQATERSVTSDHSKLPTAGNITPARIAGGEDVSVVSRFGDFKQAELDPTVVPTTGNQLSGPEATVGSLDLNSNAGPEQNSVSTAGNQLAEPETSSALTTGNLLDEPSVTSEENSIVPTSGNLQPEPSIGSKVVNPSPLGTFTLGTKFTVASEVVHSVPTPTAGIEAPASLIYERQRRDVRYQKAIVNSWR